MRTGTVTGLLLGVLLAAEPAAAQTALLRDLRVHGGFTDSDFRTLEDGRPVVKVPGVDDKREVVVLGVVRVRASAAFVIDRLRYIEDVLAGGGVAQQIGRFGAPPTPEDMTGFALPREDIRALRECRPGKCDVKLPADVMDQVQAAVDWSARDAERQANRAMAVWLVDYLNDYRRGGDAALATYDDKKEPLSVAAGFRILLEASPVVRSYSPELHAYLEEFPRASLAGAEDVYYWSVEDFGLKPTTHLYHTTIYRPASDAAIIARKQIYASHYFQAAVTFVSVIDAGGPGSPAAYLTMLTRQRFDGTVGGIKRFTLERKASDNVVAQLDDLRGRLERSYTASDGSH